MSKVFDGAQFMNEKAVELKFSNGIEVKVTNIKDELIGKFDDSEESPGMAEQRAYAAELFGVSAEALEGVSFIELTGAIDFLFKTMLT